MNEKRLQQRLRTFDSLLAKYDRQTTLAHFLRQHFKENKQMGSQDRRWASRLLYNFFRIGNALKELPSHQRLAIAEFLCEEESDLVKFVFPDLESLLKESRSAKVQYCEEHFQLRLEAVFPLSDSISSSIEKKEFFQSHFIQPKVFIRIHPGMEGLVKSTLKRFEIPFTALEESVLSFANGTKLDQIKEIQGKYEVQDFSSQKTAQLFQPSAGESWWDACAGSGGKSLSLLHEEPAVRLLVSDIRNSILKNLEERFNKAGIKGYRQKVLDLTKENSILKNEQFDGIILDAPCSGSGTWGRSPEMLSNFESEQLVNYAALQKDLISKAILHVKPGKPLIYITCSVYQEENEDVVRFIEELEGVSIEKMIYFKGYENQGDTLFAARIIR